jgi:hypothetical protein
MLCTVMTLGVAPKPSLQSQRRTVDGFGKPVQTNEEL